MAWTNIDTPSTPVIAVSSEPGRWDMIGVWWDNAVGMTWDDNTPAWANIDTATDPSWSASAGAAPTWTNVNTPTVPTWS